MKAHLIRDAEGEGLAALIEVSGTTYECMDCLGYSSTPTCVGEEFSPEFSWAEDPTKEETWKDVFAGNPEKKCELVPMGGWAYQAFGVVVSIDPPVVDCGIFLPSPIASQDPRIIGEFLAFTIGRLEVGRA